MGPFKVVPVGNSLALRIPREVVEYLNVAKGDEVFLTKDAGGSLRITPYDPSFEEQMKAAREVMSKRRNALRELAK